MPGQGAARVGDKFVCPLVPPQPGPPPHVGGTIAGPGVPTVLIGKQPAAVVGTPTVCTGGTVPGTVMKGSATVMIGKKPAARMGDTCAHGGSIAQGCPTVTIGG